ncbi:MAG: hypothetical protein OXI96_05770 [Acidimicrobiaceae bacterium]|nr:hypothetical protein [Acidimicrobiaceae bacterium]
MSRLLSREPRRFCVVHLWVAMILLFVAVAAACGGEESPPASAPAQAPTATPTSTVSPTTVPTVTPSPTLDSSGSMEVEFWELDMSSTGQDLVAFLTDEEAACLESGLGVGYARMLETPLVGAGEAGTLPEEGRIDAFPLSQCFTTERAASMNLSLFSASAGGFSAGTRDCIVLLLNDDPAIAEVFGRGQTAIEGPAMLEVIGCLTPEEAQALTPPGEGPAPNPTDIACLIEELEGVSSGDRIIAVLSGADTSGRGLTIEESAALGQAVEACGIETEFEFPDPVETNP